jgi:hypothetical protein
VLDAFANFAMPADMIEGDGYPEVTPAMKADILGGNYARVHGLDLPAIAAAIGDDEVSRRRRDGLAPPWSRLTVPVSPDPLALEAQAT